MAMTCGHYVCEGDKQSKLDPHKHILNSSISVGIKMRNVAHSNCPIELEITQV